MRLSKLSLPVILLSLTCISVHAQEGTFTDHGFIPATVNIPAEFQSMIYHDGYTFVATSDGVWKNELETKEWSRAGLEGESISAIYQHPVIQDKFFAGVYSDGTPGFKTLYISEDGGSTWIAADHPLYDSILNVYENYVSFAVRPDYPEHVYANTDGGAMIAVSTDGGESWNRMNYETSSYFGYQSCITFLPGDPDHIFQGSENPLDDAWLGRYDIDNTDPVLLDNYLQLIGTGTWSNRRPTQLQTYEYTGNNIYIGNEGALSKVTGTTHRFLYKSDGEADKPYSYIYGIWVDPSDTNHLLFGGALNGPSQPMQLYETYNEGMTFHRFSEMFEMANPQVCEIVSTGTYPAVLFDDIGADKAKLVVYHPDGTGMSDKQLTEAHITVAPNPVHNSVHVTYSPPLKFKKISVSVINSNGQILSVYDNVKSSDKIDMSAYVAGIYYLEFKVDNKTFNKKVVKL